jgi:hypothetical protein
MLPNSKRKEEILCSVYIAAQNWMIPPVSVPAAASLWLLLPRQFR